MNALIIFATEPLRLATFYAAVLSGSVTNSSEHLIDVHGPNSRVTILRMSGSSDNQGDVPLAREEVALKPVFDVDDIDVALRAVENWGGVITERNIQHEGHGHLDVLDPEGNFIQLRSLTPSK